MKNPYIIPAAMICAAILAGFWMLKPPPPPPKAPDISIHDAAKRGDIEVAKQHLAAGTGVNAKSVDATTPLHLAAKYGHKEIVELMIAEGADVNAKTMKGVTPLHQAETKEIAELLISKGADIHAKDRNRVTPLHNAALFGRKEIVELLIANGPEVNTTWDDGRTLVLLKGLDVNAKENGGNTPLDWAIKYKQTETADLLRKHGGKTGEELKAEGK